MATTDAGARLTLQQRAQQLAVRARTLQGLMRLWEAVNPADLAGTIEVFTEAAVILAMQGRDESSQVAASYLKAFRTAEGIPGPAPATVKAPRADRVHTAGLLRGAALGGIIDARRSGASVGDAKSAGLVKVVGALAKFVLTGGWMTLTSTVQKDPVALGWQRVTSDDACAFCRMLAARGAVYKSEKSADFVPHGTCACTAEPYYQGGSPLAQNLEYEAEYATAQLWARRSGTMSAGTSNDGLNNYRRWLANGSPEPGATSDAR